MGFISFDYWTTYVVAKLIIDINGCIDLTDKFKIKKNRLKKSFSSNTSIEQLRNEILEEYEYAIGIHCMPVYYSTGPIVLDGPWFRPRSLNCEPGFIWLVAYKKNTFQNLLINNRKNLKKYTHRFDVKCLSFWDESIKDTGS